MMDGPRPLAAAVVLGCGIMASAAIATEDAETLAQRLRERVEVSALVETEWALGTDRGDTQKAAVQIDPELKVALPWKMSLTTLGRARGDIVNELEPGAPRQRETSELSRRLMVGDRADLELRELYVRAPIGRTFLTLGKQQIVWGKADGVKVLDVVNPQDFREFILDDFDDSRIPLWALNAEVSIGPVLGQLVWVPDQTYHDIPEHGALYEFTAAMFQPPPPPGVRIDERPIRRPRRTVADSDAGLRLSSFWKGWDLTLNYLYHYGDVPVFYSRLSGTQTEPVIIVNPRYERSHLVGGTFSNAFGNLTVRGEVGFFFDHYFFTTEAADPDGITNSDELDYVLGFDWFGFEEALASFQFFQTWVTDADQALRRDQIDTMSTLLLRREFWNDTLVAQIMWLQSFNQADGLVRPKVSYLVRDNLEVWLGVDWFYGTRNGLFGEFDHNDRIVFGAEWGI